MATKTLITRIQNKVDTYANWSDAKGTLLNGEIAIVRVTTEEVTPAGDVVKVPALLMKVGDGTSTFDALPWLSAKASDVYDWAKAADIKLNNKTIELVDSSNKVIKSIPLAYVTNSEVTAITDPISASVTANTAAITTLNGSNTTAGSVAKSIKDAIDALDFADSSATTGSAGTAVGKFVTVVTQTNGKIAVQKRAIAEIDLPDISASKIKVDSSTTLDTKLSGIDSDITDLKARQTGHTDTQINTLIDNKINALDVSAPSASGTGTAFITSVSQTNGKISATKANLPAASSSTAGIVKLGATGGAATYDSIFGSDGKGGINAQVEANKADITDLKTSVAGGVHFRGTVTAKPTTAAVTVNGSTDITAIAGDVVLWSAEGIEYIYTGSAWEELGDVTRLGDLETKVKNLKTTATNAVTSTHKFVSQVTQSEGQIAVTYTQPTSADVSHDGSTVSAKLEAIDAAILERAEKEHTHSAYVNQNAFSNIKVGSTTVVADTATDTVEFVGSNITITPDATNDKVTFAVADGSTSTKGIVKLSSAINSESETLAATSKAVKEAYDVATAAAADAASRAPSSHAHGNITTDGKLGTASRVVVTDSSKNVTVSSTITTTELGYLDGVTSNIQTQLDSKAASSHGTHVTYGGNGSATTVSRSDHNHDDTYGQDITAIQNNYVKVSNNQMYLGNDVIIFDCGGAPTV